MKATRFRASYRALAVGLAILVALAGLGTALADVRTDKFVYSIGETVQIREGYRWRRQRVRHQGLNRSGTLLTGALVREFSITGQLGNNDTATITWNGKDTAAISSQRAPTPRAVYSNVSCPNTVIENDTSGRKATIVVDNTNSTVTLTSPADSFVVAGTVDLVASPLDSAGDDSNIAKVEFYVDSATIGEDPSSAAGWKVSSGTLSDGDHTWNAKIFDKAGNNAVSSTRTIRVDKTAPAVTINAVANGTVGSVTTITGTSSDLPAISEYGVASVTVNIKRTSDGVVPATGAATNTGTTFSTWSFSYTPSEASAQNANAKATDKAGNFTNASAQSFSVAAVLSDTTPPTTTKAVSAPKYGTNDIHLGVGSEFTLSATDGGSGVAATFYTVLSGLSAACPAKTSEGSYTQYTVPFSLSAPDGPYTLCFFSKDNVGNREAVNSQNHIRDTTPPSVTNVSAISTNNTPLVVPVGSFTVSATVIDGGSGVSSVGFTIDTTLVTGTMAGPGPIYSASASLANDGVYDLCVKGTDAVNNTSSATCMMLVAYDPSAGFVTGGGWFMSGTGACPGCPSGGDPTGRANFGFVSKYQRGATVPTGETEFQFQVGGLNFHSSSYQWLVVSGTGRAQHKGTGTINGAGTYTFLLTVIDGGSTGDQFRIRITSSADLVTGLIYDNVQGGSLDIDNSPTQPISGGQIVIHTGGKK